MKSTDKDLIEQLVTKAKNGDKSAMEQLYNVFLPYIYFMINKIYIAGYERDDLKQECFIYLTSALKKYKGNNTFIAYATCTIRNNLLYLLRKTLTHKETPQDEIIITSQCTTEDLVINKLDIDSMNRAMKNLSHSEIQILSDYYLNDLSLMTISKTHDLKYITAVKKKDRAIKKLKTNIDNE